MKNLLMTAIAILGIATINFAQVPSYVPAAGLVGWWPFTGNANDLSGNSLNGNVIGAALTSDRYSIANTSYDFDFATTTFGNQSDDIYVSYSPLLNVTNITVSLWIYPRSYYWSGNPDASAIIHRFEYGYSNPNGQVWGIDMTQNNFNAFVLDACATNSQNNVNNISSMPLTLNVWQNIVFTYDGASLKLYLDGTLINTVSSTLVMNTAGISGISIGESDQANGYWQPTDGKIDDIGIWDRALTQIEITTLYQGCIISVSTQPISQSVNISNTGQFTTLSSDSSATYQWQTDLGTGYQNINNAGQYSGAISNTLTISNTTMSNNNKPFRCIISSGSCTDTTAIAVLTVVNNVGINEFLQDNLFTVYPNPTNSTLTINTKAIYSSIQIVNTLGQVVFTKEKSTSLNLTSLPSGIYFIQLLDNKVRVIGKEKFVKE